MFAKILVVIPSRGRPSALLDTISLALKNSCGLADFFIVLDGDDKTRIRLDGFRVKTALRNRQPMLRHLNDAVAWALKAYTWYEIFGFAGDDIRFRTPNWDQIVYDELQGQIGITYGDDKLRTDQLPTHPFWSKQISAYMPCTAPACLNHYFFDNYMEAIGKHFGILSKVPIVMEHIHHSVGGLPFDETYAEAEKFFQKDKAAWEGYEKHILPNDLKHLSAALKLQPREVAVNNEGNKSLAGDAQGVVDIVGILDKRGPRA